MGATTHCDVAIVGAGIAGLAACVLLRQSGFDVICLDTRPHPHNKVGESLDWSSPRLLRRLGIHGDRLLAEAVATPKKHIAVHELGEVPWAAAPPPVIRREPLRFEIDTLHVNRMALDNEVYEQALRLGTTFIWERVSEVQWAGERVTALETSSGRHIAARWYLDATGTARLFARAMGIGVTRYGRPKVCLWTYFDTPPLAPGTTFFVDNSDPYLQWVWDIPISPQRTSVGFVLPSDVARDRRRGGASIEAILLDELRRHPRFAPLLENGGVLQVERTAFEPCVTSRVCGDNWMMIGESGSMPDPLTGNGVTSGIRHARHACEAIRAAGSSGAFTRRQRRDYDRHVFRLGHAFNEHIEDAIYRPEIRWAFGLMTATYVYTLFAFFMNALHARFNPRRRVGMAVFAVLFAIARAWIRSWTVLARMALLMRGTRRPPAHAARTAAPPLPPGAGAGAGDAAQE